MGRRDIGASKRPAVPGSVGTPILDERIAADRARALLQCTRAVLSARDEAELSSRVCRILVDSGVYAEAYMGLTDGEDLQAHPHSCYAGSNAAFMGNAAAFWVEAAHRSALRAAIDSQSRSPQQISSDAAVLALRSDRDGSGVLFVRASSLRALESQDLADLEALAADIAHAVDRLREEARREAVESSEKRLRAAFESAGVGITRIDLDGRFSDVNQKFCEMLGYSREELIGRPTREVTVPEDYGPGPAFRAEARAGRASVLRGEKRYVRKDGSELWVRRTLSAVWDENGAMRDVISVVEDITERKHAEEAVQAERSLLRTIIDAVPHYIYVKDTARRFTLTNAAWLEGRGLTRDQVQGKTVYDVFPQSQAEWMETQDRQVLESGTPIIDSEQQIAGPAPGGSTDVRWVSTTKVPLRDQGGNIIGVVGISRDITAGRLVEVERVRAEEAVAHERALLRTIIDALPDYVYVKDREARFYLGNKAWLAARGLRAEDIQGKTVFEVFSPTLAQRMHAQDQQVIESGVSVIEQEQPILMRGDTSETARRWAATTKVPMRDENGNVIGIVGFSRDITSRRRLERERAMEHAVAQVLSESRSIEETMPRLIRTICEAMDWSYGARWAWDETKSTLGRAEWWCDFEPRFEERDAHYWIELEGPASEGGLLRRVWLEQRPCWLADISPVEDFRRKPSCLKFGLRSAFAFPIIAHDARLGIFEFFGREAREPDQGLLQVSAALANQIGQFIARKQAEESLQESEQQLRAMFDNADVGIAVTGLDFRFLRVNDKYCSILGYSREELLQMSGNDVNLREQVERVQGRRQQMLRGELSNITDEKQLVRKDGSLVWVSLAGSLVRASDGSPRYHIAVIQDISASKRAAAALKESEEQFRMLAQYDVLTGLPNRSLLYDRLAHSIGQAKRHNWALAVLFIDVDRFKYVNDTFGHAAGDKLLKRVAERLRECVRSEDTVGRLSGDEFAIVLGSLGAVEDAAIVAKKIIAQLNQPFQLEGAELYVTASIGITLYPNDSVDQDALIRNADVAMYRAKDLGRNNYQFYTPDMNRHTREMLSLEGELRRALDRDELVLHYQPKVSLATGRVTGVEALLRWTHPERGLMPPGDFMPLLEETGMIVQAGGWVLRAVCQQLQAWRSAGVPLVPVAINLSPRQFLAPDLADSIDQVLREHAVGADLVEIELTESSVMTNTDDVIRTLERLESAGLQIAIDDFGTGYSSLSYLKRFPIRALKIDRSFIRDITTDRDDDAITKAVISMAHSLELKVIAEGVETRAQLDLLAAYGCDEVQGYIFAKPVPGVECGRLLKEGASLRLDRKAGE